VKSFIKPKVFHVEQRLRQILHRFVPK